MNILFLFGTRPEVTKGMGIAAALAHSGGLTVFGIATGQQTGLVKQTLADVDPAHVVKIVWTGDDTQEPTDVAWRESLGVSLGRMCKDAPGCIIVGVGDTDTVAEGARISRRENVPFVHLEAGIRHTGAIVDLEPEEINRRLISPLAQVHCCPTAKQRSNLLDEGVDASRIHVIGDLSTVSVAETWRRRRYRAGVGDLRDFDFVETPRRKVAVCTFHRSTSLRAMDGLVESFCECVGMLEHVRFVVCERPDSRWRRFLDHARRASNVTVIPAPPPLEFQGWLCRSDIVVTDSAGVQQEALILNRPVVALRENIELRADSSLLQQVRPPFLDLVRAVWQALRASMTSRELDLWLHCQSSDIIVARGSSVIRGCAETFATGDDFTRAL